MLRDIWQGLDRTRRGGLITGLVAILALFAAAAFWLLRTDYEVLFASLSPQDASVMTGELDRMKLPYRIGADGTSILVDRNTVHATRLKLMGKDMPLHGAVGFELFNNSDFGMTEFAQKINYQRALQGELTRTILSLTEIESARVHLAFPEEGLFKREQTKAKASITLALHHGKSLRPEQVSGIQRLVSAAVTGISPGDVTILNQEGVALTRNNAAEPSADVSARLELKTEIEQALGRKLSQVLERTFGVGRVLASVDVTLDMNQVRVTTEDVRGQADKPGESVTGVIVRERESLRDESAGTSARDLGSAGTSLRETDYQVGRRVEQVVGQPGSIQKLQVVAVIKDPLDATQLAQLKTLIGAAVGTVPERGDTVVVHSIDAFSGPSHAASVAVPGESTETIVEPMTAPMSLRPEANGPAPSLLSSSALLLIAGSIALLAAVAWSLATRRAPRPQTSSLSAEQRAAALARVRAWMGEPADAASGTTGEVP